MKFKTAEVVGFVSPQMRGSLAVVVGVKRAWRFNYVLSGVEMDLYRVRYIDQMTGRLYVCRDDRCKGVSEACPICGAHVWQDGIESISKHDLGLLVREGLVHPSLLTTSST